MCAAMDYQQMPAILVADAPGLDFLNSIATPVDHEIDWISDGEGLLQWLAQAGLVPQSALEAMRLRHEAAAFDAVAVKARELREWFRQFVRSRKGRPLTAEDIGEIDPVNRLLALDQRFEEVVARNGDGGAPFELRSGRRWTTPDTLLMPIAEALARLVCEEDFTHVKACEGSRCTLMFADHTRGHARRWCSMAMCGNRAKVAAHRARIKQRDNA